VNTSDRWVVAPPYPEGGIVHVCTALSERGSLVGFTPSRRPARVALRLVRAARGGRAPRGLTRAARSPLASVPGMRETSPLIEVIRTIGKSSATVRRRLPTFDALKVPFDRAVSRRLPADAAVVIGFPGACESTFRRSPTRALKVLYEVDAHPRAHNEILLDHFAPSQVAAELLSPQTVERIEREIALADRILVPSALVRDQFLHRGVPTQKVLVQPYGVDLGVFRPAAARGAGSVRLLYVGAIGHRKGIPFLLDAMRALPDHSLDLYGPVIDAELLDALPSNARWHGVVEHDTLAAAQAEHDVFVFPSVEDAFPLAVTEALAAGLPVITTTGVGALESATAVDLVRVPPGDPVALVAAVRERGPLADVDRRARSERVRQANGLVDWSDYAERVIAVIEAERSRLRSGDAVQGL
jgi:glycosyltransferase involved in cell wall biosynthesis